MSIQPSQGVFRIVCDDCRKPSTRRDGDRAALVAACRHTGWRVFRKDGKWRHSCPGCVKAWARLQSGEAQLW